MPPADRRLSAADRRTDVAAPESRIHCIATALQLTGFILHLHFKARTRTSRSFGDLLGGRGPFPFTWAILTNFSPSRSRFDSV